VLGDRLPEMVRYAELLATTGVEHGLLGPREPGRLWDRHLLNCLAALELVPEGATVLDLGSGAGLPGLVWAIARPSLDVELVEPLLRRTTWLSGTVAELGLHRVTVTRARAEDLRGRRAVDVVTARAVAPLDRLAGWALPLLAPGGVLLAMKGESAAEELAAALPTLARLGGVGARVLHPGSGAVAATVVQVAADPNAPKARNSKARSPGRGRSIRRRT
jgi:16S rRNA (guanine527-N7)-methyltransferase